MVAKWCFLTYGGNNMQKLTNKLIEILDLRKDSFTGADVKALVEAISISENMTDSKDMKKQQEQAKDFMKTMQEWMVGGSE